MKDIIKGGKSDKLSLEKIIKYHYPSYSTKYSFEYFKEEIKREYEEGVKHEREHTNSLQIAKEIAKDHIFEDPFYYSKLKKAGIDEMFKLIIKEELQKIKFSY